VRELLGYCKDGKSLLALTTKVKGAELLASLLRGAGSEARLLELMPKFRDLKALDELLGLADPKLCCASARSVRITRSRRALSASSARGTRGKRSRCSSTSSRQPTR